MWRTGFEEGHDARKEGMGQWMMQSLLVQAAAHPDPCFLRTTNRQSFSNLINTTIRDCARKSEGPSDYYSSTTHSNYKVVEVTTELPPVAKGGFQ